MIIYLHGFLSSPDSSKARMLQEAMVERGLGSEYVCPQLPMSPRAAAKLVLATAQMEDAQDLTLIGSSLGGFYATWAAEQLGCRAVLLAEDSGGGAFDECFSAPWSHLRAAFPDLPIPRACASGSSHQSWLPSTAQTPSGALRSPRTAPTSASGTRRVTKRWPAGCSITQESSRRARTRGMRRNITSGRP